MRRTLFSALLLFVSASVLSLPVLNAAESPAPAGSSPKSGSRSGEASKKTTTPPPSQSGGSTVTEQPKKKPTPAKPAPAKDDSEDERFANARKAAAEDPKVKELREKADLAKTEDSGAKAMRAYLRALYGKMRTLEPSLEDRINMTEAAALKAVSKPE